MNQIQSSKCHLSLDLVNKGGYVSRPADPVREGYKFAGWYYNNTLYDFNNSVNKNIVLIAKWERI